MGSSDVLKRVLSGFAETLQPLQQAVSSPSDFASFLKQFGWTLEPADLTRVTGSLSQLSSQSADPSSLSLEQLAENLVSAGEAIQRISASGAPAAFVSTFPRELFDYLVYVALAEQTPMLFGLLHFIGVLAERRAPADKQSGRAAYTELLVHWERLGQFAENPLDTIKQSYGWGGNFDGDAFVRSLGIVLRGFGAPASLYPVDRTLRDQYYASGSPGSASLQNVIMSVPALTTDGPFDGGAALVKLAFLGLPIPPNANDIAPADGLAFMPVITGQVSDSFAISPNVGLKLSGDLLTRPIRAELHPNQSTVRSATGDTRVDAAARLDAKAPSGDPWIPIGDSSSSRLEISAMHAVLGFSGQLDGDLDLSLELGIDSGALVIDFGEGDGFLQHAVGSQPSRSPISFGFKWSTKSGFALNGQPRLQVTVPIHQSLGGVGLLESIDLALGAGTGPEVELDLLVTGSASIGPVTASVAGMGLRILLTYLKETDPRGNLGNLNLHFGFKAPAGAGIKIDAAAVTGGGFLFFDSDKGQYAGIIQLTIHDLVTVTAIGVISTRLPNGAKGFSFVVLITAEGFKPIPLGLGFTLTGIGGLVAINRTVNEDFLREGIKNKTLNDLLFPKDPIGNAPQIFGSLNNAFPPQEGSYLFGPVLQICWGTPVLLTMDLGLIMELGHRTRLVILGRVSAILPTEKLDLVRLQMNALGVIDFDQGSISLDAVLYDSRLAGKFALTGSMAMRLNWGSAPQFALSVGGFNPAFKPPANFPRLERLAISFSNTSNFRLRAECYFAITANTYQYGAKVELFAKAGSFSVEGAVGWDVLIQFDPFFFLADFFASVQLKYGSHNLFKVKVEGELAGPKPLHIKGKATFEIFWCDFSVGFDKTLVEGDAPPQLEPVNVTEQLVVALNDARNWSGQLPAAASRLVSLRPSAADGVVAMHPLGQLGVKQTVVPLDQEIAKFGNATLSDARLFRINSLTVNGKDTPFTKATDFFAPAQFLELSDDEKLNAPSFEAMAAGVNVGAVGSVITMNTADILDADIAYETIILDDEFEQETGETRTAPRATINADFLDRHLMLGAAARSDLRSTGLARYRVEGVKNTVTGRGWTIMSAEDGTPQSAPGLDAGSLVSYSKSFVALQEIKQQNPAAAVKLMLVREPKKVAG
jgi:hypothetical protein